MCVDVHEQAAFFRAGQAIIDDDRRGHRLFREAETIDAVLPVDDQESARINTKARLAGFPVITKMGARLRRKYDRARHGAEAGIDISGDGSGAAFIEQTLESIDRIFIARLHHAALCEQIARQRE